MTPGQIELAQRLVKHSGFKWLPGTDCLRWSESLHEWRYAPRLTGTMTPDDLPTIPVLTDPATVGCLLALAREVWDRPALYASLQPPYREGFTDGPGWFVVVSDGNASAPRVFRAPTEGEALALAILGAV